MTSKTCPYIECVYNGRGNRCKRDRIKFAYDEGNVYKFVCNNYIMGTMEIGRIIKKNNESDWYRIITGLQD